MYLHCPREPQQANSLHHRVHQRNTTTAAQWAWCVSRVKGEPRGSDYLVSMLVLSRTELLQGDGRGGRDHQQGKGESRGDEGVGQG